MRFAFIIAALLWLNAFPVRAQQADNSRRFWPPEFRPANTQPQTKPSTGRYKTVRVARMPAQPASFGVTLWLLHATNDEGARGLVRVKPPSRPDAPTELKQARRVPANTPLKVGQQVRLSVEVPQDGYLYVIDREQFADGSVGKPVLIFPDNPQGNAHKVKAGRVIELPDSETYFEVERVSQESSQPLVSDLLTFIITSEPLSDVPPPPAKGSYYLPAALVAGWESAWRKPCQQLELAAATGQPRSTAEQEALTGTDKLLTRDDPLPQTVVRVAVKRGEPFLVQLPLRIVP